MKSRSVSLFVAACAAASAAAHAGPLGEKSSIELFVGGNASVPGSSGSQTESLGAAGGERVYEHLDFSDALKNRYTAGGELDYSFNSHLTGFGRAAYSQFDGTNHKVGLYFPADAAVQSLDARFGDATSREFDLGARYSFAPDSRIRPFVGAALGATRLSAIRASIDNPATGNPTAVELGRAGTVFLQRLETGVQFSPLKNLDLRLTAAANHLDGGKRSDDPNLALVGLENTRDDRGHWSYPAELGAVWHF